MEHLKHSGLDGVKDNISEQLREHHHQQQHQQLQPDDSEMPMPVVMTDTDSIKHLENIPELERQLELATALSATHSEATIKPLVHTATDNEQEHIIQVGHPPMLPLNGGGRTINHQLTDLNAGGEANVAGVPSMAKVSYKKSILKVLK